jgi:hypothetical protein
VAGSPGLVLAASLLPFREPERGQSESGSRALPPKPGWRDMFRLLRLPDYNLVVWGYVAYTFAMAAFGFWAPTYLMRLLGMTQQQSGIFFAGLVGLAGILSTFGGGFAATAWRKRNRAAYALLLGTSTLLATPCAAIAFLANSRTVFMLGLSAAIFLLFLSTGPVNTLILETAPLQLRASAMAMSIFMIHLCGDFWSPEIVGALSDNFGLHRAVLILPLVLLAGGGLWMALAVKTLRGGPVQ